MKMFYYYYYYIILVYVGTNIKTMCSLFLLYYHYCSPHPPIQTLYYVYIILYVCVRIYGRTISTITIMMIIQNSPSSSAAVAQAASKPKKTDSYTTV